MIDPLNQFPIGRFYSAVPTHLLGKVKRFPFADVRTTPGINDPGTSTRTTLCMLVKTTFTTGAYRGRPVIWDQSAADRMLKEVSALVGTPGVAQKPAGLIDPWLPISTVLPDDYYFWLVVGGMSWAMFDNSTILVNSALTAKSSGVIGLQNPTHADGTAALVELNNYIGEAYDASAASATSTDGSAAYGGATGLKRMIVVTKFMGM